MANTNAVRHGAYAARLLPDEEEPYEAKRKLFSHALGAMDAFDQQLVHLLAMLAAKVDVAAAKGAKPDAIGPLINQIIQLMRELKATRASRLPEPQGEGKTFADLFALLKEMIANRKKAKVAGENNDDGLREPVERKCARCGNTTEHTINVDGDLVCRNCGMITSEAKQQSTEESDKDEDQGK